MRKHTAWLIAASMMISACPAVSYAAYDNNDENKLTQITYNYDGEAHTRYMEKLGRGLAAVKTDNGVFLSWRLLGDESSVTDIINAPDFKVYKNGSLLATVDNSTNYLDKNGTVSDRYSVAIEGGEQCETITPLANNYLNIALDKPEAFTFAESENEYSYEYTVGDASCGDLDGDGEYEIVLKWDANPKDNSQSGITGNVILDAYKQNGEKLWRIDLGRNIRAGAHYTQFLVYDFDGDGKAEITCKTAPGSKDGTGAYVTEASADSSVRSADNTKEYINTSGYVLEGPEYFTIFNGETGAAIDTINYPVARVNASVWGDAYGNRCDRFVADVSYLDGVNPYAVYWRGYYFGQSGYGARCGVFAASFDGERLSVPEEHIFDTRSGQPGYTQGNERYVGEGNHNMTSGDFDDDGRDEFTAGALALEFDENNKLVPMWCTYKEHGDAIHIGDYDPTHQGLELFVIHEDGGSTNTYGGVYNDFGASLIDPATGEIMWHVGASKDTGRGLMANVGADGYYQVTASSGVGGYYSLGGGNLQKGTAIGYNFRIFWDADLYDETLDGTTVSSWDGKSMASVFNAGDYDCISINGTKAVPVLQADLFGDWREELVYPTSDNSSLRVFTTTDVTEYKLPTLMHDPIYRSGVASEQSAYNQPPHIGFYLADEIFRAAVDYLEITKTPDKTIYYVGEPLDTAGLQVIAHFTDGSTDDVSDYVVVTGYDSTAAGDQSITVTYSRHTAEFGVYIDAGFTVDDEGYVTGYTLKNTSAILPVAISGMTVKGIRSGALKNSGLEEIVINAEEMDIEEIAFPEGITINCLLGSDVYIYAVNNGIDYRTIDTRDYISDITYSESDYSIFGFRIGTSAIQQTIGHMTYGAGSRKNGGDSTTGYYISGDDDKYLLATAGRFSTRGRNLYFIVNDMPLASDTVDNVFEADIMFLYGGGSPAQLRITDSSGAEVETISADSLGLENNKWYTYKLIYHNGSYYRSVVERGSEAEPELIKTQRSDSGMQRFDIIPTDTTSGSLSKSQSASISFDNLKVYTNVEIADILFTVTDNKGNAMGGAAITIGDEEYTADKNGELSLEAFSGLYDVTASADGYYPAEMPLPVFKSQIEKTIVLSQILSPLEGISFKKDSAALKEGRGTALEIVTVPENAEETVFNYSSSDESVAAVDSSGYVTAVKAGTTKITAVAADNAAIKAECTVTVYEPYNSIIKSIEIEGPDMAYVPNNSVPNLVQFTAHCYDQNGVEFSVKGIEWKANGALSISSDGVLSVPKGKNAATYTVYAQYNGVTSNECGITLVEYPDSSDMIAREDCTGSLSTAQTKEVQSTTLGDITYITGARSTGGDGFTGFYIGNFNGKKCLQARAGEFASVGREAYMIFDKLADVHDHDPMLDYVFETDMYCTGTEKMIFEDSSGASVIRLEPGVAGISTKAWYHYMLIYSNGVYSQIVTDANGNYVETQLPTVTSNSLISQIRFEKGETKNETIYLSGLKYYTTDIAFSKISVRVTDAEGAAVSDAEISVMNETKTTGADGTAKFTLPIGSYYVNAAKGNQSRTVSVMSLGENKTCTVMLGEAAVEPVMTQIDSVSGQKLTVSTNGEGLKLYAAKYNKGALEKIYVADAVQGTLIYDAGFAPDKVLLWDADQKPIDKWIKK